MRLTDKLAREAAKVKVKGDDLLKLTEDESLRSRRLSSCNAVTVALGMKQDMQILSSDEDLQYVARKLGAEVVW